MASSRPTLLVFSPLPPRRNGIADYTADLLHVLSTEFDCIAVVSDGDFDAIAPAGVDVMQRVEYLAREASLGSALRLYHLGNNPDHVFMLDILAQHPGVVVLHDPSLHHLLQAATLATGDTDAYRAALVAEYGWAGRVLAQQAERYGLHEQRLHHDLPMIGGIAGAALAVIVHSDWAGERVTQQARDAVVRQINHYVRSPVSDPARAAALRKRHDIAPEEVLITSLGFVTRAKQIDLVLKALADAAPGLPSFRYVVAGETPASELDVGAEAARLGLADRVRVIGYVPPADVEALLATTDLLVNLRFPTLGETSGTVMRALAQGVCTIVNDVGAFRNIPANAAIRLPWDGSIRTRLRDALLSTTGTRRLREQYGRAAARWTRQECSLERCGEAYAKVLHELGGRKPRPWHAVPSTWSRPSRAVLGTGDSPAPLWQSSGLLPNLSQSRVLALLDDPADVARLNTRAAATLSCFLIGSAAEAIESCAMHTPRALDVGLVALSADHFPDPPGPLLRRLNSVLGFGGVLVAVVQAGQSGLHPLLREAAGRLALEEAGFEIEQTCVAPPVSLVDLEQPEDRRAWSAVKVSEFTTPAPAAARA